MTLEWAFACVPAIVVLQLAPRLKTLLADITHKSEKFSVSSGSSSYIANVYPYRDETQDVVSHLASPEWSFWCRLRRCDLSKVRPQAGNWQESRSSRLPTDTLLSPALLPTSCSLLTLPGLVRSDSRSLAPPDCWSFKGGRGV